MRRYGILLACLISVAGLLSSTASTQTPAAASGSAPVLFEGARLIVGDASAPIENSAFIMQDCRTARSAAWAGKGRSLFRPAQHGWTSPAKR